MKGIIHMEDKGIVRAISELGDIIDSLRNTIKVKNWGEEKINEEIISKDARIKELEDMLSKRPERIKREDQGLDKWNK